MDAQNAIRSRAFGLSITRNLITRVLTICHVKLPQSTTMAQKRFDPPSLSPALRNFWLFNNYSSRPNGLWVNSPWFSLRGRRKKGRGRGRGREKSTKEGKGNGAPAIRAGGFVIRPPFSELIRTDNVNCQTWPITSMGLLSMVRT